MDSKKILDNIAARMGITELNTMQRTMSQTKADEIVLLSPTGTGKTLAFVIGMLRRLTDRSEGRVQAVVITPSRELTVQVAEVIRPLATGLKTVALYGGHSVADERNSLAVTPDIIVATPGRLLDHIQRGRLDISQASALVLDEYDKSLELGFYDEMEQIAKLVGHPGLVVLTSATKLAEMPPFLHLSDPQVFAFHAEQGAPRRHTRIARVDSPERDKLDVLTTLLRSLNNGRYIVFVNHRESAERVYEHLKRYGLPAGLYHGGLDQQQRQWAVDLLDNATTPVLVSTDLGARGLDIEGLSGVIHYHIPPTEQAWTHRNGRTARMGADGTVYILVAPGEDIPDYVNVDYDFVPDGQSTDPIVSLVATLYLDKGKKEKISKGDIVGWLIQQGGLSKDEVGRINLYDHCALAAVPRDRANALVRKLEGIKIKSTRARISILR